MGAFGCSSSGSTDGTVPTGGSGSGSAGGSGNSSSHTGSSSGGGAGGHASGSSSGNGATTGSTGNPSNGDGGPGSVTAGDDGGTSDEAGGSVVSKPYHDPGTGAWEMVPTTDVGTVCKLDLAKLMAAETATGYPWLIVRYGKVCYATASAKSFTPAEAYSTTKTLGATVTGIAAFQSKKLTKVFNDMDRVDKWLTPGSFSYNKDALVAHVMGMVAHDASLAAGAKTFAYDTVGTTEINSLGTMVNNVIAQDTTNLTANIQTFTQKFLFTPLGMTKSSWTGAVYAYTWNTDLYDMAKLGLLLLNWGKWQGNQLLDEEWVYRMTHPSFEDANTGFGYLTWLNSSSNWESISGGKQQMAGTPGTCAPVCVHKKYPHGMASQNTDCNYMAPATCAQKYDVGVFNAEGLGGQLIQGHRGLDIVIVARNAQPGGSGPGTAKMVWTAVQDAVITGDPVYKGDSTMFCKDYGGNNYAPDMHEDPSAVEPGGVGW